jgi:hypothetical protein
MRQCDARLSGKNGMAGGEDETEQVVADLVIERRVEIGSLQFRVHELVPDLGMLFVDTPRPAEMIDRSMLCRGHQPGARVGGDSRLRPPLQRGEERILGEVFRHADVPDSPSQRCDEAGRFDSPYGLDGAVGRFDGHATNRSPAGGGRKARSTAPAAAIPFASSVRA